MTLSSAWRRLVSVLVVALFVISAAPAAFASQLLLDSTGGSMSIGSDVVITGSSVASPAGTVSIDCPITSTNTGTYAIKYNCSGGSFSYQSTDGTISVSAPFTTGVATLTASGGGKDSTTHYYYVFSGNFSGIQTTNGVNGAVRGETNVSMDAVTSASGTAPVCCGSAGVNSQYTPVYISDYSFSRIVKADDLWGTNAQTLGSTGTGPKQFYGPHGITLDSSGRIYVADTYNCRIDRMDDINGTNWVSFGTCGSGVNQFSTGYLSDITTDSSGRIYVADPGNSRIVRIDDMSGTNWTTFGTAGSGTDQLSGASGVAVDSSGEIYIADAGNRRIIRMDDMNGTNWTTLTQSPVINGYSYSFGSPSHIAFDPLGRIEVGDGNNVIRVDDMTGANWVSVNTGYAVQGLSVDSGGTTFIAATYALAMLDDPATGVGFLTSNYVSQSGGIFAVPVPSPVPAVTIAPSTLTFSTQNVGTTSPAQNVMLSNFGMAPLDISNIGASGDFSAASGCGSSLDAGSSCSVGVTFSPTGTGTRTGTLTFSDNAFTGTQSTQTVSLSGAGTAPIAAIEPSMLSYQTQALNTTSGPQYVYLSNSGTGPLTFSGTGIATSGDFAQTNNCGAALAPRSACTIAVTYTPTITGSEIGTLTVTGNAPTQSVSLTGTGASTAPKVTAMPESLIFPIEYVNWRSAAQTVTLKNSGTTAVSISSVTISGNFSKTGNCGTSLGAGKSCIEYVYFTPTAAGVRTGVLTYNLSSGVITVDLSGTGVATATSLLTVAPTSLSFPGYVVGDNPDQVVTITNPDGIPAGIRTITKSGSTAFTFTKTCGTTLVAGASCTVDVTFTPTAVGSYSGILYVYESAGYIHKIPLSGTAVTGN